MNLDNLKEKYIPGTRIELSVMAGESHMPSGLKGTVTGVDDMDLYILLENLCDNAIEAAAQSNNPTIKLQISEDNGNLCIYIGNTTPGNVLKNNPDMNTTKKDKGMHGFGIMNIRDIIDKYNGSINYEQHEDNYLMCRCILKKICQ